MHTCTIKLKTIFYSYIIMTHIKKNVILNYCEIYHIGKIYCVKVRHEPGPYLFDLIDLDL